VLSVPRDLRDAMVAHARADHPDEACGVLLGPAGGGRPEVHLPMTNAARSPTFFEFESHELLDLYRRLDERDEEIVVVYHSHTATEAFPSPSDIALAAEPDAHYLLVSTREPDRAELRSFRIVAGAVTEEEVVVIPSLQPAQQDAPVDDADP
jgi:proteasome lid subunit RPN8/RPN11